MGICGGFIVFAKPKEISIEATVTRADGRVEHYGRVAYYHRNLKYRAAGNLAIVLRRCAMKIETWLERKDHP